MMKIVDQAYSDRHVLIKLRQVDVQALKFLILGKDKGK